MRRIAVVGAVVTSESPKEQDGQGEGGARPRAVKQ
jgi:hypothetical protein